MSSKFSIIVHCKRGTRFELFHLSQKFIEVVTRKEKISTKIKRHEIITRIVTCSRCKQNT